MRVVGIWLCGEAVGADVSPVVYIILGPLLFLVQMIPFTLNGLGVREAFFVLFLGRFDVPEDVAFAAGFLYFAISIATSLPGAFILLWKSLRPAAPGRPVKVVFLTTSYPRGGGRLRRAVRGRARRAAARPGDRGRRSSRRAASATTASPTGRDDGERPPPPVGASAHARLDGAGRPPCGPRRRPRPRVLAPERRRRPGRAEAGRRHAPRHGHGARPPCAPPGRAGRSAASGSRFPVAEAFAQQARALGARDVRVIPTGLDLRRSRASPPSRRRFSTPAGSPRRRASRSWPLRPTASTSWSPGTARSARSSRRRGGCFAARSSTR